MVATYKIEKKLSSHEQFKIQIGGASLPFEPELKVVAILLVSQAVPMLSRRATP